MGQVLGIGCSHGPGVAGPPERFTDIYLRQNLKSELTPEHMKDPKNWPAKMREEWAEDEGAAFAATYQAILQPAYRKARQAIDDFQPDFVLVFGDDQYENLKEDCIPPFCVFAIDEVVGRARGGAGGEPIRIKGHRDAGNYLARELINAGFEAACSWRLPHEENYGHAFTTTLRYFDLDGKGFDYPLIPFSVNCYGSDLRVPNEQYPNPGRIGRRLENVAVSPPPSPMPWRCYDLGGQVRKILEASPWRAVVVGSSSWSHASLTMKNYYLWPDVEADRQRYQELSAGEHRKWRDLGHEQIRDSGQHEILNWVCLAGAMEDRKPEILGWAETYVGNSNKCVALFA